MKSPREVAHAACFTNVNGKGLAGCPRMPWPGEPDELQHTELCNRVTAVIEVRDAEAAAGTVKVEDVARWLERRYGKRSMAPRQMRDGTWREDLAWLDSIAAKEGT